MALLIPQVIVHITVHGMYTSDSVFQGHVEGFVVTQFHMSGWPEHGRPASTGSVVEMLDMITKAQMNSGNHTITVLCKSVQHSLIHLHC